MRTGEARSSHPRARSISATIPFLPSTIGRYSGNSTSSPPITGASARRSSSTVAAPNRCSHRCLDLAEQRRRDLLHLLADGRGADEPLGLERSSAAPAVALRLRGSTGRLGADEHVAPPLHAAQRGERSRLRDPRRLGQLADRDAVPDEAQEVRPHHHRDGEPVAQIGLRQPVVELVVELDGEGDQQVRERRRQRTGHPGVLTDSVIP